MCSETTPSSGQRFKPSRLSAWPNCLLRASSVDQIDTTLRLIAGYLAKCHPDVTAVAGVGRVQVEGFKTFLVARPGRRSRPSLTKTTIAMRVGYLRAFFDRIIEWDYPDVPARSPVFAGDVPIKDRALPRFLDDAASAKLLVAARNLADPFDRLVVEVLARTGMRKGELLGLTRRRSGADRLRRSGCGRRSASSTTTATSRCTPSSRSSSTACAHEPARRPTAELRRTRRWQTGSLTRDA